MNVGNENTIFIMQGIARNAEASCIMPYLSVRAYLDGKLDEVLREITKDAQETTAQLSHIERK